MKITSVSFTRSCFSNFSLFDTTIYYTPIGLYDNHELFATFTDGTNQFNSPCNFRGIAIRCSGIEGSGAPVVTTKYYLKEITDKNTTDQLTFDVTEEKIEKEKVCYESNCAVYKSSSSLYTIDSDNPTIDVEFQKEFSEGNGPELFWDDSNNKKFTCPQSETEKNKYACVPKLSDFPEESYHVTQYAIRVKQCGDYKSTGINVDPNFAYTFGIRSITYSQRCFSNPSTFSTVIQLRANTNTTIVTQGTKTVTFKELKGEKTFQMSCSTTNNRITCSNFSEKDITQDQQFYPYKIDNSNGQTFYVDNRNDTTFCYSTSNCLSSEQEIEEIIFGNENYTNFTLSFLSLGETLPKVQINNNKINCVKEGNNLICTPSQENLTKNNVLLSEADIYVEQCGDMYLTDYSIQISTFIDNYGHSKYINSRRLIWFILGLFII